MRALLVPGLLALLVTPAWGQTLIQPAPELAPETVVAIQLEALQHNDEPQVDAGIRQVWAFAHPDNRRMTGPLPRFARMIRGPGYAVLLNHRSHTITALSVNDARAEFAVSLIASDGRGYGFQWTVATTRAIQANQAPGEELWMTIGVSPSLDLQQNSVSVQTPGTLRLAAH